MIIALIGSPLSGKTTLLKKIKEKGIKVFSADSYVTQIYKKGEIGYEKIKKDLGEEFVTDVSVNRSALAKWASEEDNLLLLNEMIHPLIFDYLKGKDNFVCEIPILTSSHIKFNYDKLIMVKANSDVITKRFSERKNMNPEFIKKIINDWNTNISFDYVVDTTNNIKEEDISNIIKLINE